MKTNKLFFGDCLDILKALPDEYCDLVYLDPPFNSNATYNLLFASPSGKNAKAQIEAFDDTWHWGEQSAREFRDIQQNASTDVSNMLVALVDLLGTNDVSAYLIMISNRLIQTKRVLKETGSIYLHCDPNASHYLKIVLDGIFGTKHFRNEIIWKRTNAKSNMKNRMPTNHDIIFYYTKSTNYTFNQNALFIPYDENNLPEKTKQKYNQIDSNGRRYQLWSLNSPSHDRPNLTYEFLGFTKVWRWTKEKMEKAYKEGIVVQSSPGAIPRQKRYLDEQKGIPIDDVWTDINPLNSQAQERLGYPTQKPLALLDRIILASTKKGDVVLDPFCGCGTAIHSAEKNKRTWIGVDITHLAISLIEKRIKDAFSNSKFEIIGTPKDYESAIDLAKRDKYQFQWWACSLIGAQPYKGKRKGADGGIDGQIFFDDGEIKKILVSVKGGMNISVPMIRDLIGTIENNKADIGIFITLKSPTKPMKIEAVNAGYYESKYFPKKDFPRIQILTIEGILNGTERAVFPDSMQSEYNFKKAKREKIDNSIQKNLNF